MRTIAFIDPREPEVWSSFQRYELLFERVRETRELGVCPWYRDGRSVAEAVPHLPTLLEGVEKEGGWQAIIVTDLRRSVEELALDDHFDNPFDFSDGAAGDSGESGVPLIRLAQMLGGLPERISLEWELARDQYGRIVDKSSIAYSETGDTDLLDRYRLGLVAPQRIICLTPRDVDAAFDSARRTEIREARKTVEEQRSGREAAEEALRPWFPDDDEYDDEADDSVVLDDLSEIVVKGSAEPFEPSFWERNGYPVTARFVVCDRQRLMLAPIDVVATDDEAVPDLLYLQNEAWLRFWLSVRALAMDPPQPWDLRPYELYSLNVTVDEGSVARDVLDTHDTWMRAQVAISAQIDRERQLLVASELEAHDMPAYQTQIVVPFNRVDPRSLLVNPRHIAIFKDVGKNEMQSWLGKRSHSVAAFRELLKTPKRALRLATVDFRNGRRLSEEELEYCVLNESERDELRENLESLERELARDAGDKPFDEGLIIERTAEVAKKIGSTIEGRPPLGQGLASMGVSSGALFLGLFAVSAIGLLATTDSLWIALVGAIVIALAGLAAAWGLKRRLSNLYKDYNDEARESYNALETQANELSRRFSAYATYRKGHSILERQGSLNEPTHRQRDLERTRARISQRITGVDALAKACNLRLRPWKDDAASHRPWSEIERAVGDDSFYRFPPGAPGPGDGYVASIELERQKVL